MTETRWAGLALLIALVCGIGLTGWLVDAQGRADLAKVAASREQRHVEAAQHALTLAQSRVRELEVALTQTQRRLTDQQAACIADARALASQYLRTPEQAVGSR